MVRRGQTWERRGSPGVVVAVTAVQVAGAVTIVAYKGASQPEKRATLAMFEHEFKLVSDAAPSPKSSVRKTKSAKGTLDASEGVLVKSVLARLALIPGVCAWRNNTGALRVPGKPGKRERVVRFGTLGSGDIFCVVNGRFLSLEAKSETGRLSDGQKNWRQRLTSAGGHSAVIRTVEEAVKAVEELKRLSGA